MSFYYSDAEYTARLNEERKSINTGKIFIKTLMDSSLG